MNDRDRLAMARERLAGAQVACSHAITSAQTWSTPSPVWDWLVEMSKQLEHIEDALGQPVTPRTLFSVEG